MLYQELVTEIENLSLDEQLSLMEILTQAISGHTAKRYVPEGSLERVRGLLKPGSGQPMPTEVDLLDDYTDYLLKKYA